MWMEGLLLGTGLLPEPLLFAKWVASFSESLLFDGRIPEPNKLHPLPLCVGERRCAAATVATIAAMKGLGEFRRRTPSPPPFDRMTALRAFRNLGPTVYVFIACMIFFLVS